MNIVLCPYAPKGGSKTKHGRFPSKSAFRLKKVCYRVSLCENVSDNVVSHLLAYLSVQKWLVGDVSFHVKIWRILTHPLAKRRLSIYFRS